MMTQFDIFNMVLYNLVLSSQTEMAFLNPAKAAGKYGPDPYLQSLDPETLREVQELRCHFVDQYQANQLYLFSQIPSVFQIFNVFEFWLKNY